MRWRLSLCVTLSLVGCGAPAPQRPVQLFYGVEGDPAPKSDGARNAIARRIVGELRDRFGSNAILSIGVSGRSGADFSDIVRDFGSRAAVPYRVNSAQFEVEFKLHTIPGWIKSPEHRFYELDVNLVRVNSVNAGREITHAALRRAQCGERAPGQGNCTIVVRQLAEAAVFSLRSVKERQ